MFYGNFRHQVDGKGRVAVPAQFRRDLPPGSIVAFGTEGRLVIRPPEEWAALERQHSITAETPAEARRYLRFLYSSAREVELDAQGRVLLDPEHRRFAGIDGRAVFTGMGRWVEVVGEDVWNAEHGTVDPAVFTELNDRVMTRAGVQPAGAPPPA
ncbi:MAG TPA: division/cell wall cluster transcriptional repressor MraZ [Candidatus Dormibacteraeota bacterium]|nr:division/cell wall cluster transcriptional repressor MraZ [Candidatus Dormibacteraeota bacterium]